MERLRKKAQNGIDNLLNFASTPAIPESKPPMNVPQVEGQIEGFLGEMELQWRHHGLLSRQLLEAPLEKIAKDSTHHARLTDAKLEAKKDSMIFGNLHKSLTKDKNRALMRAMETYNIWMGGKSELDVESGAGAVWEKTFALQDEAGSALDDILEMADSQNKQGASALETMNEQSDLYKANIEDANEVAAGFREGIERLKNLTATASQDPLGCFMCGISCVVIALCVYVSM